MIFTLIKNTLYLLKKMIGCRKQFKELCKNHVDIDIEHFKTLPKEEKKEIYRNHTWLKIKAVEDDYVTYKRTLTCLWKLYFKGLSKC